jgi:hypothetical protein
LPLSHRYLAGYCEMTGVPMFHLYHDHKTANVIVGTSLR